MLARYSTRFVRYSTAIALTGLLAGCANYPCCAAKVRSVPAVPVAVIEREIVAPQPYQAAVETPTTLLAVGYGSRSNYFQHNHGQQKLMAIRAAQIDAYRNLAEQVHGFRVWGDTSVSAYVAKNDTVRTYVDAFIRGARVVNVADADDGTFEVTVETTLPVNFVQCVRYSSGCSDAPSVVRVVAPPVLAPSVVYTSP
ncbi:MAG: LPP20 family lipoprotein [Zoogloeaceae bacterium]|nr:LPP20 family lipoprotein [Zoogloeaceae bacterium]